MRDHDYDDDHDDDDNDHDDDDDHYDYDDDHDDKDDDAIDIQTILILTIRTKLSHHHPPHQPIAPSFHPSLTLHHDRHHYHQGPIVLSG